MAGAAERGAGSMRHRVALEREGHGETGALGGVRSGWQRVAELWAAITPLSGRQLTEARAVHHEATHEVVVRHGGPAGVKGTTAGGNGWGIEPGMRFVHRGRFLAIVHVADAGEQRNLLRCRCVERR